MRRLPFCHAEGLCHLSSRSLNQCGNLLLSRTLQCSMSTGSCTSTCHGYRSGQQLLPRPSSVNVAITHISSLGSRFLSMSAKVNGRRCYHKQSRSHSSSMAAGHRDGLSVTGNSTGSGETTLSTDPNHDDNKNILVYKNLKVCTCLRSFVSSICCDDPLHLVVSILISLIHYCNYATVHCI